VCYSHAIQDISGEGTDIKSHKLSNILVPKENVRTMRQRRTATICKELIKRNKRG
jgi:hypothetical protein